MSTSTSRKPWQVGSSTVLPVLIPANSTSHIDDIVFEKSANGVILTKGRDGILDSKYFQKVETKKGEHLWPASSDPPAS